MSQSIKVCFKKNEFREPRMEQCQVSDLNLWEIRMINNLEKYHRSLQPAFKEVYILVSRQQRRNKSIKYGLIFFFCFQKKKSPEILDGLLVTHGLHVGRYQRLWD